MDNDSLEKPVFLPRGVADPEGSRGYIEVWPGRIAALDLASGAVLWQTTAAARPLIVWNGKLVARFPTPDAPHSLRVAILDAPQSGNVARLSDPLAFPDWVSTADHAPETFAYSVSLAQNLLRIEWEAHARYRGGAPPPSRVLKEASRDAGGTAEIDLETGHARMLPAPSASAPPAPVSAGPHAAETGVEVAQMLHEPGAREPCIIGRRLYYFVDQIPPDAGAPTARLMARDIDTGALLWEQAFAQPQMSMPPPLRQ